MAWTVQSGFDEFLRRLTPTHTETQAAKNHRASIDQCLRSNFGIISFFRSGSFGNATSISNYSDVDYFAWIPYEESTSNSTSLLTKVYNALNRRFPLSGVYIDSPAIVVPFGTDASETTEVVPAQYKSETQDGVEIFNIANGSGGWLASSPKSHTAYVKLVDEKHNGKVRPLIRFAKAWKYYKSVPIQSFYLELFITNYALTQTAILYLWDLDEIFKQLWEQYLPAIPDPTGVSEHVFPCTTQTELKDARDKILSAHIDAENANKSDKDGDTQRAFYWLRQLYDGKFPAYG